MGLMISHRIIADHGGPIGVEIRSGEGATFDVRLPFVGGAHEADAERA
ncbi:MAG: hypothetical protein VCB25_06910 [Myxococcota bacterium]